MVQGEAVSIDKRLSKGAIRGVEQSLCVRVHETNGHNLYFELAKMAALS
jgi:hypothetical protein